MSAEEKRANPRSSRKIILEVEANGVSKDVSPWTLVTTQNFSASGVLFTFDHAIPAGTKFHVKIHFPEKAIGCEALVHRALPGFRQPLVNVAASLQGLASADREFIQNHIV